MLAFVSIFRPGQLFVVGVSLSERAEMVPHSLLFLPKAPNYTSTGTALQTGIKELFRKVDQYGVSLRYLRMPRSSFGRWSEHPLTLVPAHSAGVRTALSERISQNERRCKRSQQGNAPTNIRSYAVRIPSSLEEAYRGVQPLQNAPFDTANAYSGCVCRSTA